MRKYAFNWDSIGDIKLGRPNLTDEIDLEIYRLLFFVTRDILEQQQGTEETDRTLFKIGEAVGTQFYHHYIAPVADLNEFVNKTQKLLREKRVGIMRVEEVDIDRLVLTVDEDLECSGVPETGFTLCTFDEGFISALFKNFTNLVWNAKEVDCWGTGEKTCRFVVTKDNTSDEG